MLGGGGGGGGSGMAGFDISIAIACRYSPSIGGGVLLVQKLYKEQTPIIQGTVARRSWQQQWRETARKVLALPESVQIRKRTEVLIKTIPAWRE